MLPLNELEWVAVAMREHGLLPAGLKMGPAEAEDKGGKKGGRR
jgi:hypothetical protein